MSQEMNRVDKFFLDDEVLTRDDIITVIKGIHKDLCSVEDMEDVSFCIKDLERLAHQILAKEVV